MPCSRPLTRLASGALVCVLGTAIVLDHEHHYHLPEPGTYRPAPGPVYSVNSNYGGTAIATAVARPPLIRDF
jgi:hypothetical protein